MLHLEVGQPSTPAPALARQAAAEALSGDVLGYTTANGIAPLRARIARHYAERHHLDIDPGRAVLTAGASGGFVLAFLAAFERGERVAVTEPGYPCYRNTLLAFERLPVGVPVGADTRFQPTPALLDAAAAHHGPLRGLVVASPSNPTGSALRPGELAELAAWCRERSVRLVSDEIYHGISYGEPPPTALSVDGDAIVLNSFSKYFSMTGWRLGWMVLPPALVGPVDRLAANLFICPAVLSQHAALAALEAGEELDGHVARHGRNRRIVLDGLAAAGLVDVAPADGAFYAYADVSHLTDDSAAAAGGWRSWGGGHAGHRLRPGAGPPFRPVLLRRGHRRSPRGHGAAAAVGGRPPQPSRRLLSPGRVGQRPSMDRCHGSPPPPQRKAGPSRWRSPRL
ncbi:MAG: aminotransferase class I/II-fold pyridoxal phosphate-dependent enzyme [Acidimicrobiales bacterium]